MTKTEETVIVNQCACKLIVAIGSDKDQHAQEKSENESMEGNVESDGADEQGCSLAWP